MKLIGKFLLAIALIGLAVTSCKDDPEVTTVSVTGVKLNKATLTLAPAGTEKLTATVEPADATEKTVTWTSSDKAIATVGEDGTVTAVQAGTATITVTTKDGGKTATCAVTVSASHIAVTGVKLNKTTLTLEIGGKETLTATVEPADASDKTVSWTSSDNAKVSVSSTGEVEAKAAGTATITVTTADGSKTATCAVTVNDAPPPGERTLKAATITVFAGTGEAQHAYGPLQGTDMPLNYPAGLTLDSEGNLYAAMSGSHSIYIIKPDGEAISYIGNTDPGWTEAVNGPVDVAVYDGWLYALEARGKRIRKIKLGLDGFDDWDTQIIAFVGNDDLQNGESLPSVYQNGQGTSARLTTPRSITADGSGNFYISEFGSRTIRKITSGGTISHYAGVLCENCGWGNAIGPDDDILSYPVGTRWNPADGNVYIAAANRQCVVKITGVDTYDTFVGSGVEINEDSADKKYRDGTGTEVDFGYPSYIAIDNSGYMFVGETGNGQRIRFITPSGVVSTIAAGEGTPLARTNALLPKLEGSPSGMAVTPDGKTLYVSVSAQHKIYKIALEYNNY